MQFVFESGSYADDTTPFDYGEKFYEILGELEKHMAKISERFLYNCLWVYKKMSPFLKSIRWQSNKHWTLYHKTKLCRGSWCDVSFCNCQS